MTVLKSVKINLIDMAILFVKMSHFMGMASEPWKIALEKKLLVEGFGRLHVLSTLPDHRPLSHWHWTGLPNGCSRVQAGIVKKYQLLPHLICLFLCPLYIYKETSILHFSLLNIFLDSIFSFPPKKWGPTFRGNL